MFLRKMRTSFDQPLATHIVYPSSIRGPIDRTKYKGKGRPRADDYEYVPYPDYLKV